jgi:hypothetical protein
MQTSRLIRIQQFIFKPSDLYFRITLLETPFTFLAGCFRGFIQFIQTYVGMELRNKFAYASIQIGSRGSSGSIVSGYGLDDRAIEVRSPAETKDFSPLPLCPDRLWGPPSLLYNGYRESFPGAKARPRRDADRSPPFKDRSRISRSYTSSPHKRLFGV